MSELSRPGRFNQEEMQVVRETIAPGCSDAELLLFAKVCERTGLDPFARQIYALKRKVKDDKGNWVERMNLQTSIDGLRVIAERSDDYRGQRGPEWCGEDGAWQSVWLKETPPAAARVGVLRQGFDEPVWAIALYREYVQKKADGSPSRMWQEKPSLMLAKCAEALALRKAFPNDMAGVYTEEEVPAATDGERVMTDLEDVKNTGGTTGRHTPPALEAPDRGPKFTGSSSEIPAAPKTPARSAPGPEAMTADDALAGGNPPASDESSSRERVASAIEAMTTVEARAFFASLKPPMSYQTPTVIRGRIGLGPLTQMEAALKASVPAS